MNMDIKLKIVILGKSQAGKTSFIQNLIQSNFIPNYTQTESYELSIYQFKHGDNRYEIEIWDCGSSHMQYNKPTRHAFFRNSSAAFIIFDLLDKDWQKDIESWLEEARRFECYLVYAIGTKKDILFKNLNSQDQQSKYFLKQSLISCRQSLIKRQNQFEEIQFALNSYFQDIQIKHFYQSAKEKLSYEIKNVFIHIYDDRQKVNRQSIARAIRFDNSDYDQFLTIARKDHNKNSVVQQQYDDEPSNNQK